MKNIAICGAAVLLCLGCVTGPEEMASENDSPQSELIPVVDAEETAEAEIIPASGEESGAGFQKTSNGLKYKIIKQGTGKRPSATSTVVCHYRGWLDSGKEFDSSYKRGEPTEFPLNGVIPGWTEGLQLIQEGGKIELEVPSRLGYGERGIPGTIPPNAKLHFEVELLKVM